MKRIEARSWADVRQDLEYGIIPIFVLSLPDLDDFLTWLLDTYGSDIDGNISPETFEYLGRWIIHVYERFTDAIIFDYPEKAEITEFGRHQLILYLVNGPFKFPSLAEEMENA